MALYDDPPLHDFPDRAIRRLLEHPANLRDLLEEMAPALAPHFDCTQAVLVSREFTLPSWQQHEHDLLFELPYRSPAGEAPALVAVLTEHQRQPDQPIPLRMLLFAGYYWERQWRTWEQGHTHGQRFRLRPVLPLVFHTGPRPWQAPPQLPDLFTLPPGWDDLAPVWPIRYWDITAHSPEELRDAPRPWFQALAVVRGEEAAAAEYRQLADAVVQRLESIAATDPVRWKELLWFVLSWILRRRPAAERAALEQTVLASPVNVAVREEVVRMSQSVTQRWEDWVLERGMERGRMQGELKANRETLQTLLEERFGPVPEPLRQQIAALEDLPRLKAALCQVVKIASLAEFQL